MYVCAFLCDKCVPTISHRWETVGHLQTVPGFLKPTRSAHSPRRTLSVSPVQPVCFVSEQGIGGREAPMKATKPWNNRRFIGTFDVENTTKGDSGRYRCIVHSDKGVGVSNYGELTIKREYLFQSRK